MSALADFGGLLTDRLATRRPLAESLRRAGEQMAFALPGAAPIISLVVGLYDPALAPEQLPALSSCTELVVLDTAEALGASSGDRADLARTLALVREHLAPPIVMPIVLHIFRPPWPPSIRRGGVGRTGVRGRLTL